MSLKKLGNFVYFDPKFFQNVKLVTCASSEWRSYDTQELLGTKVEVVIAADKNDYHTEENVNNLYEKLSVKIAKSIDVPMNVEVRLVNPTAVVYGEYRNNLSVKAEDIQVVTKS